MSGATAISLAEAERLVMRALLGAGAGEIAARSTARALVAAERDGQKGHGLSRVASYVEQVRCGKVRADSAPTIHRATEAAIIVDAAYGFAYPAIDMAIEAIIPIARRQALSLAAVRRSHHFGQAGAHVERLAGAGLVALLFGNSPKAMPFWGGSAPMIGTNPIAFAAPLPQGAPLVVDLSLSVAARGKIMAANKAGERIPAEWAFDDQGRPTTDPAEALKGSMAPLGGAKGAALALMVEVIAAALTGSHFGFEASSFLDGEGPPPDVGHIFIAIDPAPLTNGGYLSRMATLTAAMAADSDVRMPGTTRLKNRAQAETAGLSVAPALLAEIQRLAGEGA